MLQLKKVRIEGFLGIKDILDVDVPENGLYLICGSNGVGKSSIFSDSILWGLFGKVKREPFYADDVVNDDGTGALVECKLSINNKKILIRRTRNHKEYGSSISLFVNKKDRTKSTSDLTQKEIESILNVNYNIFGYSTVVSQGMPDRFSILTPKARLDLLNSVSGIGVFDLAIKKCNEFINNEHDIKSELDKKIEYIKEKREEIKNQARKDISKINRMLERKTKRYKKLKSMVDKDDNELDNQRSKIEEIKEQIRDLETNKAPYENDIRNYKNKIDKVNKIDKGICPLCRSKLSKDKKQIAINYYQDQKLKCDHKIIEIGKQINKKKDSLEQEEGQLDKQEILIDKKRNKLDKIKSIINRLKGELKSIKVEKFKEDIKELKKELEGHSYDIDILNATNSILKNARIKVLGSAVKYMSEAAIKLSDIISNGKIIPQFSTSTKRRSGKSVYEITVNSKIGSIGKYSGGQKVRFDLISNLAFRELVVGWSGFKSNLIIFDEPDAHLDKEGITSFVSMCHNLAAKQAVFVISQNPMLQELINECWRVEKINGKVLLNR